MPRTDWITCTDCEEIDGDIAPCLPHRSLENQARLENEISHAATELTDHHGYTLEDLIEILTSKEG